MNKSQAGGLDQREIDALKSQPDGFEVVSVRLTGSELATWNKLRKSHPQISATELIKESIKLRFLADRAAAEGVGLYLRRAGGEQDEVLALLGYAKAVDTDRNTAEEAPAEAQGHKVAAQKQRPRTRPKSSAARVNSQPKHVSSMST